MFQLIFSKLNNLSIFPYYVITPCIYAIGSASEAILDASSKTSKKILIIKLSFFSKILKYKVCNHALFDNIYQKNNELNYFDKFFKFIIRFLIEFEFIFIRFFLLTIKKIFKYKLAEEMGFPNVGISELYSIGKIKYKNFHQYKYESIKKLQQKINLEIKIDKKKIEFIQKKIFNKTKKKIFVCIHVRDSQYRKDTKRREFRNSNINNYIETIKYLIKSGYSVVRLGDHLSNKINFRHNDFIDYANNKYKNDFLDLYLIKNCFFYIGTCSGVHDVARLFGKPILITNMVNLFSSFCIEKKTRALFKSLLYKGKKINLKEYCRLSFYDYLSEYPRKNDVDYIENTSVEIKNAVRDYLGLLLSKNFKLNKKQNEINNYLKKNMKKIFNNDLKKNNKFQTSLSQRQDFKMIRYFKSCKGSFTNRYLI